MNKENRSYIARRLEDALASEDEEQMESVLKEFNKGTYNYPELIPILERIAGATFYFFDDNGAGGSPRADMRRGEYSFKAAALSAIETIRKTAALKPGGEK